MGNIMELNNKLFETLEKIERGEIDIEKAQAIVNVSNAITNNAKLVLQVAKMVDNEGMASSLFTSENNKTINYNDTYAQKNQFARSLGYNNLSEAFALMGKPEFERQFKESLSK